MLEWHLRPMGEAMPTKLLSKLEGFVISYVSCEVVRFLAHHFGDS